MSTQRTSPWYKAFAKLHRREQGRNQTATIIAQAESSFEAGEHQSLISLIESALAQGHANLEESIVLRCLLNEALCELSRYEEAAEVIAIYEQEAITFSQKLQAEVLLRIGVTYSWLAQYPKASARLNEAVLLFTMISDREGMARGYFELSRLYININEYAIARDYLTRAISEAELLANRRLTAQILLRLGMVAHYEGDFALAKNSYHRALKLVEGTRDFRLLGSLQMDLANTLFLEERGSAEQIISLYESAIENFKKLNNSHFIAHCYNNLGDCLLRFGYWQKAQTLLTEAIELARSANYTQSEGLALITLGELHLRRGDFPAARRLLLPAIKIAEQTDKSVLAYAKRVFGYTYESGNPAALKAFNASLQLASAVGDQNEITVSQLALVEYHYVRQDYEQSRNFLKQCQERLSQKPSPYISGFAQRFAGMLKAAEGLTAEAAQLITASISIFTAVGDRYEQGRSHLELAQVLIKSKNFEGAGGHLRNAEEIFLDLESRPQIERVNLLAAEIAQQLAITSDHQAALPLVSDLALLKRLAQACINTEVLLEEFAAITFEALQPRRLMLFRHSLETQPLLLSHGCSREEALQQRGRIENLLDKHSHRLPSNAHIIKLVSKNYSDIFIYLEFNSAGVKEGQQERLEMLLEFMKLGLENCALRAGAGTRPTEIILPTDTNVPHTLIQGFVYSSPTMCRVVEQIKKIRTSDVTVLITGESGTGKELIARAIHAESARREGAFVAFNCTATPRELIESQLFGHRRGSFTGATSNYLGVIRAAKGGTLFLDEIGDLSLDLQPKLLRFLEAGEIQPLGEGRPLKVDVRVIAATNAELSRAVSEHRFREDLYHRLNIIRIHIPALHERAEEIPMLLRYYLDYFYARYGDKKLIFTDATIHALQRYHWPGNVRQLRNELERLLTYSGKGDVISVDDLSPDIRNSTSNNIRSIVPAPLLAANGAANGTADNILSYRSSDSSKVIDITSGSRSLRDVVRPIERELILTTYERNRGNFTRTAKELGLSRRGLRIKVENLGLTILDKDS